MKDLVLVSDGGTDHFIGYRVQQFTIDQSGKSPKGVYSSACLDLANKWMMSVSRKGLLWYLPNKAPAHWIWRTAKHFSFTRALFCRSISAASECPLQKRAR